MVPWIVRLLLTISISKACLLLTNSISAELSISLLIVVYLGPFFHYRREPIHILWNFAIVVAIDVFSFAGLVHYFSNYVSTRVAILLTLFVVIASLFCLFSVFTVNTPIETATLLRRINILLVVVGFILLVMNPDFSTVLRDFDFSESESTLIHPLLALSIAIILICCLILHVLPSNYAIHLFTVLSIAISLSIFVSFSYYPANQVLHLLVGLLITVYCVLVLHTEYSLRAPSFLTQTVGNTIPFLYHESLIGMNERFGMWIILTAMLIIVSYVIYSYYPLKNGISEHPNGLIIIDYLTYTLFASLSLTIFMEIVFSLFFYIRLSSYASSPKVSPFPPFQIDELRFFVWRNENVLPVSENDQRHVRRVRLSLARRVGAASSIIRALFALFPTDFAASIRTKRSRAGVFAGSSRIARSLSGSPLRFHLFDSVCEGTEGNAIADQQAEGGFAVLLVDGSEGAADSRDFVFLRVHAVLLRVVLSESRVLLFERDLHYDLRVVVCAGNLRRDVLDACVFDRGTRFLRPPIPVCETKRERKLQVYLVVCSFPVASNKHLTHYFHIRITPSMHPVSSNSSFSFPVTTISVIAFGCTGCTSLLLDDVAMSLFSSTHLQTVPSIL